MPRLLLDSDQLSVLTGPDCAGCQIATYADLVTPGLVELAGGRLVVIDRGQGDPLGRATVADIEPGVLSVEAGVVLIRQWLAEGRQGVTAYHDRSLDTQVTGALGNTECFRWISTLDGTMRPDVPRADVVQFAGAGELGFHADASIVWNPAWQRPSWTTTGSLAGKVKAALDSAVIDVDALIRAAAGM